MFLQRIFFILPPLQRYFYVLPLCLACVAIQVQLKRVHKLSPVVSSWGLLFLAVVLRVFMIELFVPNGVVKNEQVQSYQ